MKITFKKATAKHRIIALAAEVLEARLYVAGWAIQPFLKEIKFHLEHGTGVTSIVVAYIDGEAVGVCISQKPPHKNPMVWTFVRKKYRRMGIGTRMIKKITGGTLDFRYQVGLQAAVKFFEQFPAAVHM